MKDSQCNIKTFQNIEVFLKHMIKLGGIFAVQPL